MSNLESSLEQSNIQKRKFTGNNGSTSKDGRKKLQIGNVQTTANAGMQTLESDSSNRVVTLSGASAGTGNGNGNRNKNRHTRWNRDNGTNPYDSRFRLRANNGRIYIIETTIHTMTITHKV